MVYLPPTWLIVSQVLVSSAFQPVGYFYFDHGDYELNYELYRNGEAQLLFYDWDTDTEVVSPRFPLTGGPEVFRIASTVEAGQELVTFLGRIAEVHPGAEFVFGDLATLTFNDPHSFSTRFQGQTLTLERGGSDARIPGTFHYKETVPPYRQITFDVHESDRRFDAAKDYGYIVIRMSCEGTRGVSAEFEVTRLLESGDEVENYRAIGKASVKTFRDFVKEGYCPIKDTGVEDFYEIVFVNARTILTWFEGAPLLLVKV
ncbi:hypothetical protein FOZ61_008163 [Perkinsus olseni]|uniref:Uncharacterized protein n=1 Tax=Perkinsus olseni TaxID=32597 RepID=A0A7J6L603_PEROL|nr:hypothetical protein FOZ61_008163 [Perkinsus olseni]